LQKSEVVLESCNNIAHNKTTSFKIPVTLCIYSKKVQIKALVDLEATINFINRVVVENNNLVMHKLANPYYVINVDNTPNKAGQITKYVRAYIEAGANELYLKMDVSRFPLLDDIGDEDPDNYILSWADTTDPGSHQQVMMIATILNNQDQYGDSDYEDTKTWKAHVSKWLHEYGNVFSKHKSERIPLRKLYNHAIDFMEGAKLPKPAKVYLLSLAERNSLDTWINEELRKGYIRPFTSLIAAPFFFVKKYNGSL